MFDAVAALDKVLDSLDREAREPTKLRAVLVPELKRVIEAGHEAAEVQLLKDRDGMRCARALSNLTDAVVRAIHDAVVWRLYPNDNPSTGEQLAVVATGGYGRGTMAPGSDIDLLFLLPYKQTAWSESVVEAMLYVLWDLKLKVGHATRSVEECLREARADMTIRTALLEARYLFGTRLLFEELVTRFDAELVMGTAHEFVEAKLRERDTRITKAGSSRYLVEPNVKDGKGGCATSTPCSGSPSTPTGFAIRSSSSPPGCSRPRNTGCSSAATSFYGGCAATCTSSPDAPRSGWPSGSSPRSPSVSATARAAGCPASSAA